MLAVKVYQLGGPDVLQIEQVSIPSPIDSQVCIKVLSIGINPVETYIRSGKAGRMPTLPYTPGQDAAGVVHAIGPNVTQFQVGDRVWTSASISGTYAQYTLSNEADVCILPENITFDQGASLHTPYFTAYHALFHIAQVKEGETIFIHGCSGATGTAVLQFAKSKGIKVIGSAGTPEGLKLIQLHGADLAVNHREEGYLEQVFKFTNGLGVNAVIEMLANVNLGHDLPLLAKYGRVAVIGSRGTVEIDPRDLMTRRASIHGVFLHNATEEELKEIVDEIFVGLTKRHLHPEVYLALPLSRVADSHVQVISPSSGALGKIVVHPWE